MLIFVSKSQNLAAADADLISNPPGFMINIPTSRYNNYNEIQSQYT